MLDVDNNLDYIWIGYITDGKNFVIAPGKLEYKPILYLYALIYYI